MFSYAPAVDISIFLFMRLFRCLFVFAFLSFSLSSFHSLTHSLSVYDRYPHNMQLTSVTIQDEPLDMDDEPPPSEMLSAASTVSSSLHSSVSSSLHDEPPLSEISEHSTVSSSLQTNLLRDTVMHTQSHSLFSRSAIAMSALMSCWPLSTLYSLYNSLYLR